MACFTPKDAWMSNRVNDAGNNFITWNHALADKTNPVEVPCGKCIGCRLDKRKRLGVQVFHEAQMHDYKCMATFTYSDENNPGVIVKEDMQKAIKRMRSEPNNLEFKYLVAGEYGENTHRPHFHMAIIGYDFLGGPGVQHIGKGQYMNRMLTDIWGNGAVHIVPLTIERCMYVAAYTMKKMGEEECWHSHSHYMGKTWLDKHWDDIARTGRVVINGGEHPIPPKYFEWADGKLDDVKASQQEFIQTRFKTGAERWAHRKTLDSAQVNAKARIALKAGKTL